MILVKKYDPSAKGTKLWVSKRDDVSFDIDFGQGGCASDSHAKDASCSEHHDCR
jgi:hypothetical protein